jgi:adenylate cyclase class 2
MREIEIKVSATNVELLERLLNEKGTFLGQKRQVDEYYSPEEPSFTDERPVKEWLRIRETHKGASINYKKWHFEKEGRANYADEYESNVENAKEIRSILQALGFNKVVTVDKQRKSWNINEYEVSIDTVAGLGNFVEIEFKGDQGADP